MLNFLKKKYSSSARQKRGELFRKLLSPTNDDRILDYGGGTGAHLASILPYREHVHIADILTDQLRQAEDSGFKTIQLSESEPIGFEDGHFDIVFSSSVIEHVTIPKKDLYIVTDTREFKKRAFERQKAFADEIRRLGKSYFVQTPYRYFPIESHTWLPVFIVLVPRGLQVRLIRFFNKFWPKKTSPDWYLLTHADMQALFPEAEILEERSFGFVKSLMAIKKRS